MSWTTLLTEDTTLPTGVSVMPGHTLHVEGLLALLLCSAQDLSVRAAFTLLECEWAGSFRKLNVPNLEPQLTLQPYCPERRDLRADLDLCWAIMNDLVHSSSEQQHVQYHLELRRLHRALQLQLDQYSMLALGIAHSVGANTFSWGSR
ncbi:hypothetical protein J7T55_015524 [Diaporthe amygdali]|uniref:uncharacterized protein n=1 Tax=Phomopsis amygdali TaxID=1214568 RepID=UPI0022FEA96F|nr:uncharacterized protein J7T55_015524 [Diaporthe amygdali]KAJ0120790.1 hypothetical protein J7T55_015524 [Diaporthe amygdali]